MGSSTSKAASTASKASKAASLSANNTARKYPTRSPIATSNRTNVQSPRPNSGAPGPQVHSEMRAVGSRDRGINLDASDPDLALNSRLRTLGPVTPNPTLSNSSTFNLRNPSPYPDSSSSFTPSASAPSQSVFPSASPTQNPALSLLTARYRLAAEAEEEFESLGRKGSQGRSFLDVVTLRQVLVLRDQNGLSSEEIERKLDLKKGTVERLGERGVVSAT